MRVHISNRADCAHELPADAPATTKYRTQSLALLAALEREVSAFLAAPIQANNNKILSSVEAAITSTKWSHAAYLYRRHRGYTLRIEPNNGGKAIEIWCSTKQAARAQCEMLAAKPWNF